MVPVQEGSEQQEQLAPGLGPVWESVQEREPVPGLAQVPVPERERVVFRQVGG